MNESEYKIGERTVRSKTKNKRKLVEFAGIYHNASEGMSKSRRVNPLISISNKLSKRPT